MTDGRDVERQLFVEAYGEAEVQEAERRTFVRNLFAPFDANTEATRNHPTTDDAA